MAKKIEMLNDQQEVVHPLTSSDCVIMENGKTLEEVMGDGIATPTVTHEGASFQVGVGDSNIEVVDGDVAGMTLEGQTYQNILPKPTTLIMETDEKEFKINDKIDNNIVLDDNVAEIATIKGQTYVNAVQEESASEYVAIGEELNGQSITTTGKPEGMVKNATLEGLTLVNTIQEPSGADATVLELDADIDAQYATIDNTVQGGIHGAILLGNSKNVVVGKNKCNMEEIKIGWIDGTSGEVNNSDGVFIPVEVSGTITISNYIHSDIRYVYEYDVNGRYLGRTKIETDTTVTIVLNENTTLIKIGFYKGTIDTVKSLKLQVEQGEIATEYEPCSLTFVSVKIPILKTTGKNLFDVTKVKKGYTLNSNTGVEEINNKRYVTDYINVENTTSIAVTNQQRCYNIWGYDSNKVPVTKLLNAYADGNTIISIPNNVNYIRIPFAMIDQSIITDDIINNNLIQIEYGKNQTPYEPYKSSTLTTPSDVILRKVGDVQDELDLETGKLTQRIGEIVLDGSEEWNLSGRTSETVLCVYIETGIIPEKIMSDFPLNDPLRDNTKEGLMLDGSIRLGVFKNKLETADVSGMKKFLNENNIKIQYTLDKESIKTVDLSIVDQDNNAVKTIQTHPTMTHVSTSSQGLIPNIVIPSQLKYPTIIKPSTTYTVQLKQTTVNSEFPLTINLGGTTMAVPSTKFTITTPSELTSQDAIFTGKNNVIGEVVITEGDTTSVDYGFFEGMKDVKPRINISDAVYSLIDLSKLIANTGGGANYIVDGNIVHNTTGNDGLAWDSSTPIYRGLKPSTKYIFYIKNLGDNALTISAGHSRTSMTMATRYIIKNLTSKAKTYVILTTDKYCSGNLVLKVIGNHSPVSAEIYCTEYTEGIENILYSYYFTDENTQLIRATGKNLCDLRYITSLPKEKLPNSGASISSTILTEITSNSIVCETASPDYWQYACYRLQMKPNTTYISSFNNELITPVSDDSNRKIRVYVINSDIQHTSITPSTPNRKGVYKTTTLDDGILYFVIADESSNGGGVGYKIKFKDIQIEEAIADSVYEPYKGVTIEQSIDSIPLTSDMFEQGYYDYNKIIKGMSLQQLTKQESNIRLRSKSLIPVKPNTTYQLSDTSIYIWALPFDKNGGTLGGRIGTVNNTLISNFTTDANTHYIAPVIFNVNGGDGTVEIPNLSSLNLTLQEVTDEIVLRSIGDVKDTLNLTTGEYVQRIGEYTFDGSDDEHFNSSQFVINNGYAQINTDTINNLRLQYGLILSSSLATIDSTLWKNPTAEGIFSGRNIGITINASKLVTRDVDGLKKYLTQNPITVQYELITPIIKKVNLTNTTKLPSYASTTHYDTIVPSNSLVPNIKIPSTIDYNVAIKPSTQYTIRANTTNALSVNLGGSTGTLANGKVTLTTPSTLAHNSLKLGNGKAKEVMVIEGSEIKDNVPFFNGMKNVQMGGIKLVNIARLDKCSALVTANTNKTQFTYTSNGANAYHTIYFDTSLLKTNTVYTVFADITTNTSDNVQPVKFQFGNASGDILDVTRGFVGKIKQTITSANTTKDGLAIVFRPCSSGGQVVIKNPMIIEGDWTHLDEIPFIESEMIIEQPIIRSQGKNLCNIPNQTLGTSYGVTVKSIDGKINISGTPNNNYGYVDIPNFLQPNKKYAYSVYENGTLNTNYRLWIRHDDGGALINPISGGMFVTRSTNISRVQFVLDNLESGVSINKDVTIQIEEGSTATTYEPFKQHTLSSNRVIGYEQGIHYGYSDGTKYTNGDYNSILADVEGLSVAYVTNGASNFTFWDKDNVFISGKLYLDTSLSSYYKNGFIAVPSNAKYMRFASEANNYVTDAYTKATVTGELPLRSLPNGVCDSFNLVTGEYVQRVGEVVLDGSHPCKNDTTNGTLLRFNMFGINSMIKVRSSLKCDKLPVLTDTTNNQECIHNGGSDNYKLMLWIDSSHLSTQDASGLNKYLSQNPITVQYELETPIVRKIGLTAKGNYREQVLDGSETWAMDAIDNSKTVRMTKKTVSPLQNPLFDTVLFTDDYHVRARNENHSTYEYITCIGNGIYINIYQSRVNELSVQGCTQWLSQNPIKVGYISSAQSSESYSNIHKPIFFNDVKVQFMNDNVDIQPTLTLQARSRNSYVMDMMKANTKYTLKALTNASSFTIDGTLYSAKTNGTFTSPSALTNKLLITATGVQELMIIEGDVTSKQLPYYKGIRSSFDNTDKVEVFVRNKNLVKELYPMLNNNTCVIENGVITIKGNGDGSGELNCVFNPSIYLEKDKTYTFSFSSDAQFGKTNGTDTVEAFLLKDGGTGYYIETYGFTRVFTCGATGYYNIRLDINKNNTTHKFYNIQIEESPTATPYQPYKENSTIINMSTRWETVKVVKPVSEDGALEQSNGSNCVGANISEQRFDYIPVQPNDWVLIYNNSDFRAMNCCLYDINKNFIQYTYTTGRGLTIPKDCYFIRGYSSKANTSNLSIKIQRENPIALNELPNGVKDELIINRATSSAKLIRRVGKVVLDGGEEWFSDGVYYYHNTLKPTNKNAVCDKISISKNKDDNPTTNIGTFSGAGNLEFYIINVKTKDMFKEYLKRNPITVYYELAEPVITEISLSGFPFVYKDGSVQLNTEIPHTTKVKYNVNQEHLINGQNETIIRHDKQIDNLYDYIELYLEEEYRMELFRMQLELSL